MLKTSRKWKNAVRYQAIRAFPSEWKVLTSYATGASLGSPASTSLWDLSDVAQGVAGNERIGRKIVAKRIEIWGEFVSHATSLDEPYVRQQLIVSPTETAAPGTDTTAEYEAIGDWCRGKVPMKLTMQTPDRMYRIITDRRYAIRGGPLLQYIHSVEGVPAGLTNASTYDGTNYEGHTISESIQTAPGGLFTTSAAVDVSGSRTITGTNSTVRAYVQVPKIPRPSTIKFHISKKFPGNGLEMVFDDSSVANPGVGRNALNMRIAASPGSTVYFFWFARFYFTDA